MGVGLRMKAALRERKMTIKDLASKADIPLNTLYSISKRDSERVDRVILQRIADALDVSVEYLAGEVELKGTISLKNAILLNSILEWAEARNITGKDLCNQLGLPFDEWHRWSEYSSFSYLDYLPQIANILNVPQNTFQKHLKHAYFDNEQEEKLLMAFCQLNATGQDVAVERIQELCKIEDYRKNIKRK